MRPSPRFLLVFAALGLLAAPRAFGQPFGPSGGEFVVNTTTTGAQYAPAVGVDLVGRFFIVWNSPDGDENGVFGRRFNHDGTAIDATQFRVNTSTTGAQIRPTIAVGAGLTFDAAVTWQLGELFARRFDASGFVGPSFQVNTTGAPVRSSNSMDAAGNWVAVWNDNGDVVGQRYNSAGTELGGEFTIATTVGGSRVDVARASGGTFVVVWNDTSTTVFARRYSSAGAPIGAGFQVNTNTATTTNYPNVAANDDGFVVVWTLDNASGDDVRARLFDSAGSPQTTEFRVNTYTTGPQILPDVGMANSGAFTVIWNDRANHDGGGPSDGGGIWAKRYSGTGAVVGQEFLVNTTTTSHQTNGVIAMQANGDFVVSWTGGPGVTTTEIWAQRYCHKLSGDADNDGALSIADVFYLINSLYAGGAAPLNNCDTDGNGTTDILDVFALINNLYANGPGPSCPQPFI